MSEMDLFMENQARESRLRKTLDTTVLKVEVIDDWDWWFKKGMVINVKKYPFKADRDCNLNSCHCSECMSARGGHYIPVGVTVGRGNYMIMEK